MRNDLINILNSTSMSNAINKIKVLEKEKIIRSSFGAASLNNWENEFDQMMGKLDLYQRYWSKVDDKTNQQVENTLNSIYSNLQKLSTLDETQFVTNKQNISSQINQSFNEIKQYWPHYAVAAIEETGILSSIDFKMEFEELTSKLKQTSADALLNIEEESKKIIAQAKSMADEIESSVRKTAQKVSVQEAQEQFQKAIESNQKNITIWSVITIILIISFLSYIIMMFNVELMDTWTWKVVYYSGLRVTLIGFIGTLLAFSLKILKSYLHIKEHNAHRQRIANSMSSFAESAISRDQRDLILSRLVDSVANFGNSGMINNNDDESNSKITIDNITRSLSAIKPN